jgi:isopentenyl phosphate kinase
LSQPECIILKIGGSAITEKSEELEARTHIINRLAEEIRKADVKPLVLVHGGGSFGHPSAKRNSIKEGFRNPSQLIGFAETHHFMTVLNGLVMDSLIMNGVPAVSITPSSCMATEDGRIKIFESAPLRMLMKIGCLPVLYGDAVTDTKRGFTILSGDQIVSALAVQLNARRIIMGVDVDGLFDSDPKKQVAQKPATLLRHVTLSELHRLMNSIARPDDADVTGGMSGKLTELVPAIEQGVSVTITNATKADRIYKALRNERVEGTAIEKE